MWVSKITGKKFKLIARYVLKIMNEETEFSGDIENWKRKKKPKGTS